MDPDANVQRAVPFFRVANLETSLQFYVGGLGFHMTNQWIDDGVLRWCWLELGGAALLLQEFRREGHDAWVADGKVGVGVTIYFTCRDALTIHRDAIAAGLDASTPFVGNGAWVTGLSDPDGYRIEFESPTDVPEGTVYAGAE